MDASAQVKKVSAMFFCHITDLGGGAGFELVMCVFAGVSFVKSLKVNVRGETRAVPDSVHRAIQMLLVDLAKSNPHVIREILLMSKNVTILLRVVGMRRWFVWQKGTVAMFFVRVVLFFMSRRAEDAEVVVPTSVSDATRQSYRARLKA